LDWPIHGFFDARAGPRLHSDSTQSEDATLAEARLQLETMKYWEAADMQLDATSDFVLDGIREEGDFDPRQLRLTWTLIPSVDIRAGRQVLSWGTGDQLFINDVQGPLGPGIGNIEVGYYDSKEDRSGDDPFVNNSELRLLAGYEQELAHELTGSVQYYLERMVNYSEYQNALPSGMKARDENRQVLTLRLTKLLLNQDLTLSLFTFYSPTDQDIYIRPKASYEFTDAWTVGYSF
jgi:hypothetical protein